MMHLLEGLAAWVTEVVYRLGYIGVALLTALENLFPPIPSELVLPLAGFLVGQGRFGFFQVMLASTLGSVSSALMLYGLGALLGEDRVYRFIRRFGRYAFVRESDLDRAHHWFTNHGGKAVFIGRLVPGIRSIISIPAGLVRMRLLPFILYTTAGSLAWNGFLVGAGWALGSQWTAIVPFVKYFEYGTLVALVVLAAWFARRRWAARRSRRAYRST